MEAIYTSSTKGSYTWHAADLSEYKIIVLAVKYGNRNLATTIVPKNTFVTFYVNEGNSLCSAYYDTNVGTGMFLAESFYSSGRVYIKVSKEAQSGTLYGIR